MVFFLKKDKALFYLTMPCQSAKQTQATCQTSQQSQSFSAAHTQSTAHVINKDIYSIVVPK